MVRGAGEAMPAGSLRDVLRDHPMIFRSRVCESSADVDPRVAHQVPEMQIQLLRGETADDLGWGPGIREVTLERAIGLADLPVDVTDDGGLLPGQQAHVPRHAVDVGVAEQGLGQLPELASGDDRVAPKAPSLHAVDELVRPCDAGVVDPPPVFGLDAVEVRAEAQCSRSRGLDPLSDELRAQCVGDAAVSQLRLHEPQAGADVSIGAIPRSILGNREGYPMIVCPLSRLRSELRPSLLLRLLTACVQPTLSDGASQPPSATRLISG